jgi:large subunit ribosomal protein L21
MYAIVEVKGKQYKVEKGKEVYVDLLGVEEGSSVDFDQVLLLDDDKAVKVGAPYVEGAKVKAKVEKQVKGKKLTVFKFRAKKGFRKRKGHRQKYNKLMIEDIVLG